MTRSPWQRALGQREALLDPGLRAYFGPIPLGQVGVGSGIFEVVGSPRRWLWPILGLLALDGIVFPVWERDVPFTVINRPTTAGSVQARRVFQFAAGDEVMTDEIGITPTGLTDRLGRHGLVASTLRADVVGGSLVLRSTGVVLRLGRVRLPLGVLSPTVTLVESTRGDGQHVSLRMSFPGLGTVYEYSGSFSYAVGPER